MKTALAATLAASLGALATTSTPTHAVAETVYNWSTAPEVCQAFTPGIQNTIRNRVTGAQNVGADPVALACSFANIATGQGTVNKRVYVSFVNDSSANASINCTVLNGTYTSVVSTINKTVNLGPGAGATVSFSADDTPSTTDTDLGSYRTGINCTLPTGVIMTTTGIEWSDDFA